MTKQAGRWGVPDCSSATARQRILSFARNCPDPIVAFVAPSGYGKTIAAAQFAHAIEEDVLWVSLQGQHLDFHGVVQAVADEVARHDGLSPGALGFSGEPLLQTRAALAVQPQWAWRLILDDLVVAQGETPVGVASQLLVSLRPFVRQVVMTARDVPSSDYCGSASPAVCDARLLALDKSEAQRLAHAVLGHPSDGEWIEGIRRSCKGHPALFRMMISSPLPVDGVGHEPSTATKAVVERLVGLQLLPEDRGLLELACLLKEGPIRDLQSFGESDAHSRLARVCLHIPLVSLESNARTRDLEFVVHDLVSNHIVGAMAEHRRHGTNPVFGPVLQCLAARSRWPRAVSLLRKLGTNAERIGFLVEYGQRMIDEHHAAEILAVLDTVPLSEAMSSPRCLFLWSQALREEGHIDECLAKASASIRLALHQEDWDTLGFAMSQRIVGWLDQGKASACIDSAEECLERLLSRMSPAPRLELLASYASALGMVERNDDAMAALALAESEAVGDAARHRTVLARIQRIRANLRSLGCGDYSTGIRDIAPLVGDTTQPFLARQALRGNLAWMLAESGRLGRAQALLEVVLSQSNDLLEASYLPLRGLDLASKGKYEQAVETLVRAQAAAVECCDEVDLHINRLYQSAIERAAGAYQASLDSAERAHEGLSHGDFFGASRLAAAEIAASLLALSDTRGARCWLTGSESDWLSRNKYHALCAAMVLSVADHRDGDTESGVARLAGHGDYILSDSANWRMAMYCRSFPELLGLLALAVGAKALPVHLVRMVLAEDAERTLRACKRFMPRAEWDALGLRILGEEQFRAFVERKGRPICRVRMFGGLDVSIDDRTIRERDWKKRKSRLLFAMLVSHRGQDVPRDQILDYLWPELDEVKAKNNFYVAWSTMKAALTDAEHREGPCPYVESRRGRCRVVRESLRSDIDEFEELLTSIRGHEAAGRVKDAVDALQELMSVYRGDFLPGDVYDDWFSGLRDKYRFEFVDSMLRGVELLLEQDDPCEALVFARRGIGVDPYREDLYQAALRCHILAGQRSAAIETFIQCKTQLAEQLGLDPGGETISLYQQVLAMEERPRPDTYGLS